MSTAAANNIRCPLCRQACNRPDPHNVVPDRLLGRLLGHLSARCVHCGETWRVEEMTPHLRQCVRARLANLRNGHDWTVLGTPQSPCLGRNECNLRDACRWAVVIVEVLSIQREPQLVQNYLREWLAELIASSPTAYMLTRPFQTLVAQIPAVIAQTWDQHWDTQAPQPGGASRSATPVCRHPGSLELIRMYDALEPVGQGTVVVQHLARVVEAAICCRLDIADCDCEENFFGRM